MPKEIHDDHHTDAPHRPDRDVDDRRRYCRARIFSYIVHDRTGDWRPNPISSLTTFDGDDYNCHRELTEPAKSTPGCKRLGTTLFGGEIWAQSDGFNGDIYVKFQSHMFDCTVSGGP